MMVVLTLASGHDVCLDGRPDLVDRVLAGINGLAVRTRGTALTSVVANPTATRLWIVAPAVSEAPQGIARLRATQRDAYIVVVGSAASASAELSALQAGADAYWTLPVTAALFDARVQAILRRGLGVAGTAPGNRLVLHPSSLQVQVGDALVQLSPREYSLVAYLHMRANSWVPTEELWSTLFPGCHGYDSSLIRTHVHNIRRKLGAMARVIRSVRGRGLMLQLADVDLFDDELTNGPGRSDAVSARGPRKEEHPS